MLWEQKYKRLSVQEPQKHVNKVYHEGSTVFLITTEKLKHFLQFPLGHKLFWYQLSGGLCYKAEQQDLDLKEQIEGVPVVLKK